MNHHIPELAANAYALLTLDRQIVGIKFAYDIEVYEKMPARAMRAKIAYCVVVRAAMTGRSLKLSSDYSGCNGSSRALGFITPTEAFTSGELYHGLGLYKDLPTSKQVANSMITCRKSCYGIMAQPLEKYENDLPDVVIVATDARNAMRLLQGYTYSYGSHPVFKMTGNQAICVECTSHPLEADQMNLSMLCSGTRYLANWKPGEIAIGFPYHKFVETVEGLLKTADAVELDPAKLRIQENLVSQGFSDPNFQFGHTYYTDLEKKKALMRKKQS
ncbi:MAG: DUF169 domain-containing protein [Pseudomonadota bacterium]